MSTYTELRVRRSALRQELRELEQELCGIETAHKNLGKYAEWGSSGDECKTCWKRFQKLCHRQGCACPMPHT